MRRKTEPLPLAALAAELRECSSRDERLTEVMMRRSWDEFRQSGWEPHKPLSSEVLAGLILRDDSIARLLPRNDREQLNEIARRALDAYQQAVHPPNPVGRTMIEVIKEIT